jgi:hypothetical protein
MSTRTIIQKLEERLFNLKPVTGLSTGVDVIDDFLYWRGLPEGDLVLFHGKPGEGATRLWLQTAVRCRQRSQKSAWVGQPEEGVSSLLHHLNISRIFTFSNDSAFEALSDLIKSKEFTLIGCSLNHMSMCYQHLIHLKNLCQMFQVTLVFIGQSKHLLSQSVFPLVIDCEEDFLTIHKAVHRPTPLVISGQMIEHDLHPGPSRFMLMS